MAAEKKHPLGFVIEKGILSGPFTAGIEVAGVLQKNFKLREATVDDLLDAELEADVSRPLNFNAALLTRQLVAIGTFEGPVTMALIRRLKPADWRILRAAQAEVDALGEGEPADAPAS